MLSSDAEIGQPNQQPPEDSKRALNELEKSQRMKFIVKVYVIFTIQILSAVGFIAAFFFCKELRDFARRNIALMVLSIVFLLMTLFILMCYPTVGRIKPWNFILLVTFTLSLDYLCAIIVSYYPFNEIPLAGGLCALITILLTIFALQTTIDFTVYGGLLITMVPVLMILVMVFLIFKSPIIYLVYVFLFLLFICAMMVVNVQAIVGEEKAFVFREDDYILAAISLYVDVINLLLYILSVLIVFRNKVLQIWSKFVSSKGPASASV